MSKEKAWEEWKKYNALCIEKYQKGDYESGVSFAIKALEIAKKYLGETHPDTLVSMNALAVFYQSQGKYDQALSLY